jgi:hypothetical protein
MKVLLRGAAVPLVFNDIHRRDAGTTVIFSIISKTIPPQAQ